MNHVKRHSNAMWRDNSFMPEFAEFRLPETGGSARPCVSLRRASTTVLWLQGITLAWMLIECGISLYAAASAHSPAILAFGSDSLIELFSAAVVLFQLLPRFPLSQERANRTAGLLLFVLAGVVAAIGFGALVLHVHPATSRPGMVITLAALAVMPALAWMKNREAVRSRNPALRADAVQSATCAYLAGITFMGLAINAAFGAAWFDSLAALAAVPLLIKEGKATWRGEGCACC
jgi:divalent metal cation (Fe/Co/Zn/Cd) transporter